MSLDSLERALNVIHICTRRTEGPQGSGLRGQLGGKQTMSLGQLCP